MAVHAHPDDESSKGAATMAKYAAEGVDVLVATCTGGERGSVLNPKLDRPEIWENISTIRRDEMERAREILGVRQAWLGFVDSGYPEGDPLPPLPEAMLAAGLESPYGEWLKNWDASKDKRHRVTTRVPCGEYFEVRDDALRAHATQVDPDGFWFRIPLSIQREAWPTEDYQLAR